MIKQRFVIARNEAIPQSINRLAESEEDCFVVPPRKDGMSLYDFEKNKRLHISRN